MAEMCTDHTPLRGSVKSNPPGRVVLSVAVRPGGVVWTEIKDPSREFGDVMFEGSPNRFRDVFNRGMRAVPSKPGSPQ
jgi:hypothetical protein